MKAWIRLRFAAPGAEAEAVAALLWEMDSCGFQEAGNRFEAYFPFRRAPARVCEELRRRASAAGIVLGRVEPSVYQADPQDWIVNWKKNYRGFPVGRTFFIHPSWEASDPDYPVNLQIDPSQAFGTGTHPSTQLCLLALRESAPRHRRMLDVGTGSGILSAAARRLNPALDITAIDNRAETARVARALFADNDIRGVRIVIGEASALNGRFDLVAANLTLGVFRRIIGDLKPLVGGTLIASGIRRDQEGLLRELIQAEGLLPQPPRRLEAWSCLTFRRAGRGVEENFES